METVVPNRIPEAHSLLYKKDESSGKIIPNSIRGRFNGRNVLRNASFLVAASAIVLACTACGGKEAKAVNPTAVPQGPSLIAPSVVDKAGEQPLSYDDIYQGATAAAAIPEFGINIPTRASIPTRLLNFSNYQTNNEVIFAIYDHLEALSGYPITNPSLLTTFQHTMEGKPVSLTLVPKQDVITNMTERIMMIVARDAPKPKILPSNINPPLGLTAIDVESGSVLSYIRTASARDPIFGTVEYATTSSLAIEACNQMTYVLVFDNRGIQATGLRSYTMAQEMVCNSIGRTIAGRMLNVPFPEFSQYLRGIKGRIPVFGYSYDYILPTESNYNALAPLGPIIK